MEICLIKERKEMQVAFMAEEMVKEGIFYGLIFLAE